MAIRALDPANDIDSVMEIWLSSNIDAHSFVPEDHWQAALPDVRDAIVAAQTLVFEDAPGDIVGFIGCVDDQVEGMFVRADRRSQGVGRMLMDEAKTRHDILELSVYLQNPRAFAFYKREGFDQHGMAMDAATSKM